MNEGAGRRGCGFADSKIIQDLAVVVRGWFRGILRLELLSWRQTSFQGWGLIYAPLDRIYKCWEFNSIFCGFGEALALLVGVSPLSLLGDF